MLVSTFIMFKRLNIFSYSHTHILHITNSNFNYWAVLIKLQYQENILGFVKPRVLCCNVTSDYAL